MKVKLGDLEIIPEENIDESAWIFVVKYENKYLGFTIGHGYITENIQRILFSESMIGNIGNIQLYRNGVISGGKYMYVASYPLEEIDEMNLTPEGLAEFTRFIDENRDVIVFEILRHFWDVCIGVFEFVKEKVKPFLENPCMFYFSLFYKFMKGL